MTTCNCGKSSPTEVRAKIGADREILFCCVEDYLLFMATFSTLEQYRQACATVGRPEDIEFYPAHKSRHGVLRCANMMMRTQLSDGTTLFKAMMSDQDQEEAEA